MLRSVRYVASDKLPLLPASGAGSPLLWVNLAFASELDQHIDVVDGAFPKPSPTGPVEVLISEALASKLGLQVGEEYLVLGPKRDPANMSVPIKVAGVWRAHDAEDTYWFYTPNSLDEVMFIPEESYTSRVVTRNPNSIYVALWYLVTDGSGIRSADGQRGAAADRAHEHRDRRTAAGRADRSFAGPGAWPPPGHCAPADGQPDGLQHSDSRA